MVVHLVSEPCRAFAIVPFESAKGKRSAIGEDYSPPNSLQRFLTISNVRIIYSHKRATGWIRTYLPVTVLYTFSRTKARMSPGKSELSCCSSTAGIPAGFDLIPPASGLSCSAQVFRLFPIILLSKIPFLLSIVLTFVFCSLSRDRDAAA